MGALDDDTDCWLYAWKGSWRGYLPHNDETERLPYVGPVQRLATGGNLRVCVLRGVFVFPRVSVCVEYTVDALHL